MCSLDCSISRMYEEALAKTLPHAPCALGSPSTTQEDPVAAPSSPGTGAWLVLDNAAVTLKW